MNFPYSYEKTRGGFLWKENWLSFQGHPAQENQL